MAWGFRAFYRNPITGEHLVVLKDWRPIKVDPETLAQLIKAKEEATRA